MSGSLSSVPSEHLALNRDEAGPSDDAGATCVQNALQDEAPWPTSGELSAVWRLLRRLGTPDSEVDAIEAVLGYRARFAKGHLMPEAAVIEMEAQLALGNRERAVELGRQLETTPTPAGERARELLRKATP